MKSKTLPPKTKSDKSETHNSALCFNISVDDQHGQLVIIYIFDFFLENEHLAFIIIIILFGLVQSMEPYSNAYPSQTVCI